MTGKEALEKLLDALKHWQGRNTIFDKIHSKHILDELELLDKYKMAFEILKKYKLFILNKDKEIELYQLNTVDRAEWLENEEYELLEELMNNDN